MLTRSVHSDRRAIHPPTWWHRGYAPAALLPLLPRWHRCHGHWGALLGDLEACAAVRVRLPTRAKEGGAQGWNSRHAGEQPGQDTISILRLNLYFFRSSPEKRWNEADDAIDYEKSQRT